MRSLLFVGLYSLLLQAPAPAPQSPQDCITSSRGAGSNDFKSAKVANLRQCLAAFDIDKAPADWLATLVVAYIQADQLPQAHRATDTLDALGDVALDDQFKAHAALHARYRGRDEKAFNEQTAWLVAASRRLSPELRAKHGEIVVRAYVSAAEASADDGKFDRAVELLKTAQAEWPDLASRVEGLLSRYLTVGTDATPITAATWLHRKDTTPLDFSGKVTMIQFTAHWCGPCKYSYPAMRRLSQRFAKEGLQVVFFTQFFGYFGALKNLTAEAELAHDRKYYAGLGIDFPIAIGLSEVESAYKINGIPQINLIDGHGKIRSVMVGYSPETEKRLVAHIRSLLAEK